MEDLLMSALKSYEDARNEAYVEYVTARGEAYDEYSRLRIENERYWAHFARTFNNSRTHVYGRKPSVLKRISNWFRAKTLAWLDLDSLNIGAIQQFARTEQHNDEQQLWKQFLEVQESEYKLYLETEAWAYAEFLQEYDNN